MIGVGMGTMVSADALIGGQDILTVLGAGDVITAQTVIL